MCHKHAAVANGITWYAKSLSSSEQCENQLLVSRSRVSLQDRGLAGEEGCLAAKSSLREPFASLRRPASLKASPARARASLERISQRGKRTFVARFGLVFLDHDPQAHFLMGEGKDSLTYNSIEKYCLRIMI